MNSPLPGSVSWFDLTVPNADEVRDFYSAVVGWTASPVEMEGYSDYCMMPAGSEHPASGICHQRGPNANLPAQWLIYITVADLRASLAACVQRGGRVIAPERDLGGARVAVIQDPAGAVAALYQPPPAAPVGN